MTVIVAYKGPEGVYMAGDSMAADSNDTVYISDPKVFSINGFTIGYAGSFRFGQILSHCFLPPAHNPILDDSTYMFSVFLEYLRDTLESYGLLKSESGIETIGEDGSALVVYRDQIYHIQEDLSLLKVATPYAAIGGGMSYSIGAMYALAGTAPADVIAAKAIEAAVCHFPRCGGKITMVKHDGSTESAFIKPRVGRPKKKETLVTSKNSKTSPVSKKVAGK